MKFKSIKEALTNLELKKISIQELNEYGFKIFPYTVNDEERMEELIRMGVHGIISDEPELLWKVIKKIFK